MRNVTLLAIGDSVDFDSFKKFDKQKKFFSAQGFCYRSIDYKTLFKTNRIDINTKKVIVITFFPFKYWNKHIECRKYKGLYGNLSFMKKFQKFSDKVVIRLRKLLSGKQIKFINDPRLAARYRDKQYLLKKLSRAGVKVPNSIKVKDISKIKKLLSSGKKIYVKPRCGSMGKGITYLSKEAWQTNFRVKRNGCIIQRYSDYGWRFKDVTGNQHFIKTLLKGDFIFDEAIPALTINDKKIDFRIYASRDKILYIYPRVNNEHAVTTNISQGGKGRPSILKKIPQKVLRKIKIEVLLTMHALKLDFAGIDVIVDKDFKDVYVIDINMFPGFPKTRTYNLARQIINSRHTILNLII